MYYMFWSACCSKTPELQRRPHVEDSSSDPRVKVNTCVVGQRAKRWVNGLGGHSTLITNAIRGGVYGTAFQGLKESLVANGKRENRNCYVQAVHMLLTPDQFLRL